MPIEAMSRFVLSDEDDAELSEEEFLRARLRGLQAYFRDGEHGRGQRGEVVD